MVDNKQGLFVSGSRVRVRVPVSEPYSAVLVPDTAILSDQDKRYVLVVDDKNVVSRRDVAPGKLLDDGMRVILPSAAGQSGGRPRRVDHRAGTAACADQLPGGTREAVRQPGVVNERISTIGRFAGAGTAMTLLRNQQHDIPLLHRPADFRHACCRSSS